MYVTNRAGTAGADVAVGDYLRCVDSDWEGRVVDLDTSQQKVVLMVSNGRQRALGPDEVYYNWWDQKLE